MDFNNDDIQDVPGVPTRGYYIDTDHIVLQNPMRQFGPSTLPNDQQAVEFILEAEAEVGAVLAGMGFDPLPTTATGAFKLVQSACAKCAAARVEDAAPTSNRRAHFHDLCEEAKKALGAGVLPDLGTSESRDARVGTSDRPFFTRDMEL